MGTEAADRDLQSCNPPLHEGYGSRAKNGPLAPQNHGDARKRVLRDRSSFLCAKVWNDLSPGKWATFEIGVNSFATAKAYEV